MSDPETSAEISARARRGMATRPRHPLARYLFAVVAVAAALAIRLWLTPLTGTGAPFVLFFAAVLLVSLFAGIGPGIFAVVLSLPLAAHVFVVRAGYSVSQAGFQALLFGIDGVVVVYLTYLVNRGRHSLQLANRKLRRANEEIGRSVARARDVLELSPDAFFLIDREGRFSDVNRAACQLLGFQPEELVGEKFVDFLAVQDASRLRAIATLPRVPGRGEWTLRRKDGAFLSVEVSASILPDGRWQAFARDISKRQRMEAELRESENKFRTLAEAMPQIVWITSPEGWNTYFNQQWVTYTGLSLQESYGHGWNIPFHPDDRQRAWDAWQRAVQTDGVYSLECRLRRADGVYRWWLIRGVSLHDESGKVVNWFGTCTDVEDIKRTEEALRRARDETEAANEQLRESEERFRLTIDEAPIGMALVALDGRFVRVNRALSEIVGYTPAELTELTFQTITHPDDLDTDLTLAGRLARGEISRYTLGKRYVRKDGTIVDIDLSASLLRGRDGAPLYYIAQMEDVTERKRAEEALRLSEQFLSLAVDASGQGLWDWNIAMDEAQLSRRYLELIGYTEGVERASFAFFQSLIHPDDLPTVMKAMEEHLQGRSAQAVIEYRAKKKSGEYVWLNSIGRVMARDGSGAPLRMVGVIIDITERKRAEEALRLSEAKFSGIVSISADAIISIDDEQRITIFNTGAEKIFGYSKAEAVGASLDLLLPERFRSIHRQHVAGFAAGKTTARPMGDRLGTIAGRRKNGEEFPAEAAISKLQVGDKTLLTVALRDITLRKRIEKEQQLLAEASAVLGATLDYEETLASVARLVVRDFADWCIVEIIDEREPARRVRVVSADPARAELCTRLEEVPIDRDRPYLLRAVVETKRPLLIEHIEAGQVEAAAQGPEHLRALRVVNPMSVMGLPLLRQGELLGTLTFVSSTPSRVYGPSDLRLALALADRAAVAIENARLYRAAVHATHLRDHVLGIVAHDLRNPLNAILLQAASLQRYGPAEERRSQRPREIIHRAATRMNRLIQDLLDVARMEEAGPLPLVRTRLPAGELVVEAVDMQRPIAASSSVELRLEVARGLPDVWGDHDRLLQVFENLIGNAMKFTAPGGRVTVGAEARPDEVLFRVADTGRGIAAESLPRVFDQFWQATRSGRLGAGLGLHITKGIVEAHGGCISVESTPGRGSTFRFSIPRAHPVADRPSDVLH